MFHPRQNQQRKGDRKPVYENRTRGSPGIGKACHNRCTTPIVIDDWAGIVACKAPRSLR